MRVSFCVSTLPSTPIKWLFHLRKSRANATNCPKDRGKSSWSIFTTAPRKHNAIPFDHPQKPNHLPHLLLHRQKTKKMPQRNQVKTRGWEWEKRNVNICIYDFCGWLISCWVCQNRKDEGTRGSGTALGAHYPPSTSRRLQRHMAPGTET